MPPSNRVRRDFTHLVHQLAWEMETLADQSRRPSLPEVTTMAVTVGSSRIVIGMHLGTEGSGPAVALVDERRETPPRFTLRHLFRLPSRASYGVVASGVAAVVRRQVQGGQDWRLVLGSTEGRTPATELLERDLWPLVRTVITNPEVGGPALRNGSVSDRTLAGTLRSYFERGQLGLAASLLRTRVHVDRLLESLLEPRQNVSPALPILEPPLDDLVIAAGLALWSAGRVESAGLGAPPPHQVRYLTEANDLL